MYIHSLDYSSCLIDKNIDRYRLVLQYYVDVIVDVLAELQVLLY